MNFTCVGNVFLSHPYSTNAPVLQNEARVIIFRSTERLFDGSIKLVIGCLAVGLHYPSVIKSGLDQSQLWTSGTRKMLLGHAVCLTDSNVIHIIMKNINGFTSG